MARSSPAEGRRGRHGIQIDTTDSDQKSEHYPPVIGDPRSANRIPVGEHKEVWGGRLDLGNLAIGPQEAACDHPTDPYAPAADQPLDRPLLRRIQQPLLVWLAATLAADQTLLAFGVKALADVEHTGLAEPDLSSDRRITHAVLAQANHLSPSLLLGRRSQLAHVHVLHI